MIDTSQKSKYFSLSELQNKTVSHKICNLKPRDKSIELRVIVLELLETYETKIKDKITQFLLADETGSIIANFFGETGKRLCVFYNGVGSQIRDGDILYINGAYTTIFNKKMILYQGIIKSRVL